MSQVTIAQFAEVVKIPADRLLEQLANAGVSKSNVDDVIADDEKMKLLDFLQQSHGTGVGGGSAKSKVTLKRKSTLKVGGARAGAGKSVNVEVRKKRTLQKPSETATAQEPAGSVDENVTAERE
ncbi:MAG TPA: translation initiation factor IF-2, partial [Gammaproteobacteria bacterium]|nr:translation initiation factor IF-2 [Gammaproteobacteria bacterium]